MRFAVLRLPEPGVHGGQAAKAGYTKDSSFNWYTVGKTSQVRWHPNASCWIRTGHDPQQRDRCAVPLLHAVPAEPRRSSAGYGAANNACASYGNHNCVNYYTGLVRRFRRRRQQPARTGLRAPLLVVDVRQRAFLHDERRSEANKLRTSDRNWKYKGTTSAHGRHRTDPAEPAPSRSIASGRRKYESHFFTERRRGEDRARDGSQLVVRGHRLLRRDITPGSYGREKHLHREPFAANTSGDGPQFVRPGAWPSERTHRHRSSAGRLNSRV